MQGTNCIYLNYQALQQNIEGSIQKERIKKGERERKRERAKEGIKTAEK